MPNQNQKRLFTYLLRLEVAPGFNFQGKNPHALEVDYSTLDWKGFAKELFEDVGYMPKAVSVYLSNETFDMSDRLFLAANPDKTLAFTQSVYDALDSVKSKDCRGNVMNMTPYREKLHPVVTPKTEAAPAIGIYLTVKATATQMMDYEQSFTHVFGQPGILNLMAQEEMMSRYQSTDSDDEEVEEDEEDEETVFDLPLPEKTRNILSKHLKVEYAEKARLIFFGARIHKKD